MKDINQNQNLILDLLKKSLFNREIYIPERIEANVLYKEAMEQTVFPLIYKSIVNLIPTDKKSKWQMGIYQILANNIQILHEHKELHELLIRENIPYTIIKGAASAKYYPEPKLRMMGDVDFVVKKKDLSRVGKLLEEAGFTWNEDKEHSSHHVYQRGLSTWEMHWSMAGIPTGDNGKEARKYFTGIIDTAIYDPEGYIIPDEFHHGLVMLIHTAEHLVNTGIGLRHLCDWAVFINELSDKEFRNLFEEKLKACGLWRFAQLLTQLSIKYLGSTEKTWAMENVDEKYLSSMMADIFAGGNFGIKDSERINQAKLFTNEGRGTVGDVGFVRQSVSTLNEKAERALPVITKHPILMPIGWLYVASRHLARIRKGSRPSIHVGRMIKGATERRSIYREFHLFEGGSASKKYSTYDWLKKIGMPIYKWLKASPMRKPLYHLQDGYFIIRYWLYGFPRISKEDVKNVEQNVTFLYKSFERQKQAKRLYKCIRRYYPKAKIIIVDDSKELLVIEQKDENMMILHIPFNSGLCKGLAAGLEQIDTPYVMRMDDDELLTPKSKIHEQLFYLQKNNEVDLVALQVTHLDRKRLTERYRSIRMNKELKIPVGTIIDGKEVVYKPANVYLVRTESLRRVGYDPNIRMIDHHEFFYRAAGEIVTVMDLDAYVMHCHNRFESQEYDEYRSDWKGDEKYIAMKYNK